MKALRARTKFMDNKTAFCWAMFDHYTYGLLNEIIDTVAYQCGIEDFDDINERIPNEQYARWYDILWETLTPQKHGLIENLHNNSHVLADEYVLPYFENLKKSSNN